MFKINDWKKFFNENNIPEENQNNWYFSGLTIKECEIALKNGWDNHQILNNCVSYRDFEKIKVLNIKKSELDMSLDILENILNDNKNTFKSLPENYEHVKIDNLNDDILPKGAKKNDLRKAI